MQAMQKPSLVSQTGVAGVEVQFALLMQRPCATWHVFIVVQVAAPLAPQSESRRHCTQASSLVLQILSSWVMQSWLVSHRPGVISHVPSAPQVCALLQVLLEVQVMVPWQFSSCSQVSSVGHCELVRHSTHWCATTSHT